MKIMIDTIEDFLAYTKESKERLDPKFVDDHFATLLQLKPDLLEILLSHGFKFSLKIAGLLYSKKFHVDNKKLFLKICASNKECASYIVPLCLDNYDLFHRGARK